MDMNEQQKTQEGVVAALINAWVKLYGPIPWNKAVAITVIVQHLNARDAQILYNLDKPNAPEIV